MADEEIDHELTDEAVCPHCGYTFDSSWEFNDDAETDCPICEKLMRVTRNTKITYSTQKLEEADDDDDNDTETTEEEEPEETEN